MRRSSFPFSWIATVAGVAVWLGGCAPSRMNRPREVPHPRREPPSVEVLRERTHRSIERAIFYKPNEASLGGPEGALAPLIVQGVTDGAELDEGFGAIVGEPNQERVDADRPTIYVDRGTTRIGRVELEQWTYFWRYPATCGTEPCASCAGRGVRVTLGVDGLPVVWEALSTDDDRRVLFISRSLEEAAAREFGGPLPGRTFSIERAVEEARNTVVVRLLDDASVAMGPYVYLDAAPDGDVTTVLCRCMPSQVEEFVETRYYNLVPKDSLITALPPPFCKFMEDFLPKLRVRWSGTMSVVQLDPSFATGLNKLLRWPNDYR